jgi:precorrin-3B methylase
MQEIDKAGRDLEALLNRKLRSLTKTTSPRAKSAICADIAIIRRYFQAASKALTEQEREHREAIEFQTKRYKRLSESESLLTDVCHIHGIDLQLWAMKHPTTIKAMAETARQTQIFMIPPGVKNCVTIKG